MSVAALQTQPAPSAVACFVRGAIPFVVAILLALAMQFWVRPAAGGFYVKLLTDIGINIVLAVSLNIVNGFTGQFSIGHAGFMSVGAYAAAAITYYGSFRLWGDPQLHGGFLGPGDWLFVGGCLVGGVVAAMAGLVVGLPSLRLRGDYLAIVTLGFGEILRVLLQRTDDALFMADEVQQTPTWALATKLGGSLGFTGLAFYTNLFWVYLAAAITLICAYRIKRSSYGRALLSIREDEIAAEAMGIRTTRLKVTAFVLAAFFAGVGGGLYAHTLGITLSPQDLGFQKSFDFVIMVVLGGMGSISGVTVAAILLSILPEALRSLANPTVDALAAVLPLSAETQDDLRQLIGNNIRMILYALALIVMMIVRPQGLFGLREIWDFWRRRRPKVAGHPA